ncbi:MAG: hypothetical protein R6T96_12600 [Longimicrobiales bacterium]
MSEHVGKKLSFLDRYLTLWIGVAMVAGIGLGYLWPRGITALNEATHVGTTSIPIAAGLILMMYPRLSNPRINRIQIWDK